MLKLFHDNSRPKFLLWFFACYLCQTGLGFSAVTNKSPNLSGVIHKVRFSLMSLAVLWDNSFSSSDFKISVSCTLQRHEAENMASRWAGRRRVSWKIVHCLLNALAGKWHITSAQSLLAGTSYMAFSNCMGFGNLGKHIGFGKISTRMGSDKWESTEVFIFLFFLLKKKKKTATEKTLY